MGVRGSRVFFLFADHVMADTELLVVGGGIVGTSTALFSAQNGLDVMLLERNQIGSGASGAAAGILKPPDYLDRSGSQEEQNSYAYFSDRAYQFYHQFLPYLETRVGISTQYSLCGSWELATTEQQLEALKTCAREREKHNRISHLERGKELRSRYACLSDEVVGGLFRGEEARLRPDALMDAMGILLEKEGVTVVEQTEVNDFSDTESQINVESSRGACSTEQLLIACGSWSGAFDDLFDEEVSVRPRKGEMIRVQYDIDGASPIFRWGDYYFIPRGNSLMDVGATDEDRGFDRSLEDRSREQLLDAMSTIFRDAENTRVMSHWAGFRPYAERKGGPFLGRVSDAERVYVAAGHYRAGIIQGPLTGKLLSSQIAGQEPEIDLSPFRPGNRE